ncbi:MAG: hypothetical protein ACTSQI_03060 [Candidatus Helarchaeota archaeon]
MSSKRDSKDSKNNKSVGDLEAELARLQLEITLQTQDIKQKFLNKTNSPFSLENAQAEFFATIATLDTLLLNYQQRRVDSQTYNTELKSILTDFIKIKYLLEQYGIDATEFIKEEKMLQKFPHAIQQLEALGQISLMNK